MKLGRVVGTVVSTINVPIYDARTLLLCDLLEPDGVPAGGYLIAVDTVGAGAGETVLILDEGNSARQVLGAPEAPVRTLVVGIVDAVTLEPPVRPAAPAGPARDDPVVAGPASTATGAATSAGGSAATRRRRRRPTASG